MNKYKPTGWKYESQRHSLASKGIKTGKIHYARDTTIAKGAIGAGAGAVALGTYSVVGGIQPGIVAADIPVIATDIIGVSAANILKTIPYVAIGGVVYKGMEGTHKLLALYYDKKLSKEALQRKISSAGKGNPIIVSREELKESIDPEQSHTVSVTSKDNVKINYMMGASYPSKKELKENVGKPLRYVETSMFGPEYKENGDVVVVGPDAYTNRKWYATVTMKNGLIEKVK